ncbi:unnamed protein product [Bubo scandiacus]
MCLQLSSRRYLGIVKPQQLARSPSLSAANFFPPCGSHCSGKECLLLEALQKSLMENCILPAQIYLPRACSVYI